jgi:hypothetical protein
LRHAQLAVGMPCRYLPRLPVSVLLRTSDGAHVSVFLYVAIIGIWLFVLVPRWLKRAHEPAAAEEQWPGSQPETADDSYAGPGEAETDSEEYGQDASPPVRLPGPQPARRSRVLQARRRLLTMLVLVTVVAAACVALKLTAWWACVPPAVMLGAYVLLLREAALADTELARRRAELQLRAQAVRQRAYDVQVAAEERYSAQIIDISGRVGDQLYDQYADATVRAVGD